jgi:hypothetical protein
MSFYSGKTASSFTANDPSLTLYTIYTCPVGKIAIFVVNRFAWNGGNDVMLTVANSVQTNSKVIYNTFLVPNSYMSSIVWNTNSSPIFVQAGESITTYNSEISYYLIDYTVLEFYS